MTYVRNIETEFEQAVADLLEFKDPVVEIEPGRCWTLVSGACYFCENPWTKKLLLLPNFGPEAVTEGKHTEVDVYVCDECDKKQRPKWGRDSIYTVYTRERG